MKCPKCGFNSFEFLDSCKKCGTALTPFKKDHGIRPVVLPPRQAVIPAPDAGAAPPPGNGVPEGLEAAFSWEPSPEPEPAGPVGEPFAGAGPDLGCFDAPSPAQGAVKSSETFETFSFEEAVETVQAPAHHGKGVAEEGLGEIADLPEASGSNGSWSGEAIDTALGGFSTREFEGFAETSLPEEVGSGTNAGTTASFGEIDLDVFPFEAETVSPKKTAPSGEGTTGPGADEFDSLFSAPEPDKH